MSEYPTVTQKPEMDSERGQWIARAEYQGSTFLITFTEATPPGESVS
jgi:hypothetical protein